jgi:hypothetical protein
MSGVTLTIAVLTGRRPDLLAKTLDTFTTHHPDIWESASRTVFHNSGDPATAEVLDRYRWQDRQTHHGELLGIGQASNRLSEQALDTGADYILRLEDDWLADPVDWLNDAVDLADRFGQVRLRRLSETRATRCLICRKPIRWVQDGGHLATADAHYTYNPTLMSRDQFAAVLPHKDERDDRRRFHGRPIAQHVPGVFAHAEGRSLRRNGGAR